MLDPARAERGAAAVRAALPGAEVFYALKCNSHPAVVDAVRAAGCGFEVASPAELRQLQTVGVAAARIMCLHPIKSPAFIRSLSDAGVDRLAVDSAEEVEKIAELYPGARAIVRVSVTNAGSRHPLGGKFGCPPDRVVGLLKRSRELGLRAAGLTTHVGSQCESLATWRAALTVIRDVAREAAAAGLPPELVSLGGGFPARYTTGGVMLGDVGRIVSEFAPKTFAPNGCEVTVEPGRAIAAGAGTLVSTVIGIATRSDGVWAYLDVGVYHGLFEAIPACGGFRYPVAAEHPSRPTRAYRLGGPTCDGIDVLPHPVELPELRVGERIAFHMTGAYSATLSCPFNGFPVPTVVLPSVVEPARA